MRQVKETWQEQVVLWLAERLTLKLKPRQTISVVQDGAVRCLDQG